MSTSTAEQNRAAASALTCDLSRLLREFSRDYERRIGRVLARHGYPDISPAHCTVLTNLGTGAVRVTELADRAQVTQQAMGKMLKELERMGYVARDVDSSDKRARAIRLTEQGKSLVAALASAMTDARAQYAEKIGERDLLELEAKLRDVLGRLELAYMPDAWTQPAAETAAHREQYPHH